MKSSRHFCVRTSVGAPLLLSLAAVSCTLTTNLDFVGPAPKASNQPEPKADAHVSDDAGSNDASPASNTTATSAPLGTSAESNTSANTTDAAPVSGYPDAGSATSEDASLADAARIDASILDASLDSASSDSDASGCANATDLLTESYEGDLTKWSAVNWQSTACQETDIATDIAVESAHAVRSRIECESDADHLHNTSLQLFDEIEQTPAQGIEAPHGLLLSFSVWLSVGYDFDADHWLNFVRFFGTCDRSDAPIAVGLNDPDRQLSITRLATEGDLAGPVVGAPEFPLAAWTHVDVYVNYTDGSLVVWQDGALVTSSDFESGSSGLCHVEFGTMASGAHSDLVTFQDDVHLSLLHASLEGTEKPPTLCGE